MKIGKSGSIASKQSMNLVVVEKKEISPVRIVLTAAVIFILLLVVAKFGILDRYNKVNAARMAYQEQVDLLSTIQVANADYDDVVIEYNRYSFGAMTDQERAVADRGEVLDLIEKYLIPSAQIESVSLNDNQLAVQLSGVTLQEASSLINVLMGDKLVDNVSVSTAASRDSGDGEGENASQQALVTLTISLADNTVGIVEEQNAEDGGEQ